VTEALAEDPGVAWRRRKWFHGVNPLNGSLDTAGTTAPKFARLGCSTVRPPYWRTSASGDPVRRQLTLPPSNLKIKACLRRDFECFVHHRLRVPD
jgi:hypothetical protein